MTARKILGYIFILLAILLTLALVGQLQKFLGALIGVIKIFGSQMDGNQVGQILGTFVYWIIHISLTVFLWTIGRRWIKSDQR
jgi:hypothetical protein